MSAGSVRNPIHVIIDLLYRYHRALERVHQARTEESRRESLDEWDRCHPAVWENRSSRNDTVRTLADPAKAWLTRANSRYTEGQDLNLIEECVHALSAFGISSSPMAMPDVYSKMYTTEGELWRRWTEQSNQLVALGSLIARLRDLAARAGEEWTLALPLQRDCSTAFDRDCTRDQKTPALCLAMPLGQPDRTAKNQKERDHGKGGEMSKGDTREYLMKVEALKGMLNQRARGGQPLEKDYAALRSELVAIDLIRDTLPTFVLTCHTIQEFWLFIQPMFATYSERTAFLQREFAPVLTWLEAGVIPAAPKVASPPPPKPDLVIVTVNEHETRAVVDAFQAATGAEAASVPLEDRVYHDLGILNGTKVFHAISEMGSGSAGGMQQTVEKAIRLLDPGAVIAVGIAFGVDEKKQSVGDILLSKQLRLYDLQRVGKNKIVLRGAKPDASPRLTNHFVGFAHTKWKGARFKAGVMLTGEKLIDNVDYRKQLLSFESEAIGGEMEGAGLYVSGYDQKVDWIVLKAICDFADGNKGEDKDARQKLAAANATHFLVEALRYAPLKRLM